VRAFYHVEDELATLDGVIYRRPQLVIPKSYRPIILKKLHLSHQGSAATLRRTRSCVYWPQMSNGITCHINQCVACAYDAPSQQKETIQHHDIPAIPWCKIGMDLFSFKQQDYLMIVDYFSDFLECEELKEAISKSVIKASKRAFARFGIPEVVHSDNGLQFASSEFAQFHKEWGFHHTTSSPKHPQSNGKAEAAVKVTKRLFRRSEDPCLALLELRNSPTAVMSSSPIEQISGRPTRSLLPTGHINSKQTKNENACREKAAKKLITQKNYDKSAKDLMPLTTGLPVLIRDTANMKNKWNRSKVLERLSDRSFSVLNEEPGNIIRRTRTDLQQLPREQLTTTADVQPVITPTNCTEEQPPSLPEDTPHRSNLDQNLKRLNIHTRPLRERKLPPKYQDYVLK